MKEAYLTIDRETIFCRSNDQVKGRPTVLFLHGLGESSLCFYEAFETPGMDDFNLVAPDLPGYGRSSQAADGDYSFDRQVERIEAIVKRLEIEKYYLVGHSLGGTLGTYLCGKDDSDRIERFVNIEGYLTQHEQKFSGKAVQAHESGKDFTSWFRNDFMRLIYDELGSKYDSGRRYYASLQFARPEAFLQNSVEILDRNARLSGSFTSEIGELYCSLKQPKVFCYGDLCLSQETRDYIALHDLRYEKFDDAFHWVMIDKAMDFYRFLQAFLMEDRNR